jgi:hypothetical protein
MELGIGVIWFIIVSQIIGTVQKKEKKKGVSEFVLSTLCKLNLFFFSFASQG